MEYNRWVRNFLAFFRDINNLDYDEEDNVKNNIIQKDIFIWYLVEEFTDDFSTSIIFLINLSEDRPTKSIIQLSSSLLPPSPLHSGCTYHWRKSWRKCTRFQHYEGLVRSLWQHTMNLRTVFNSLVLIRITGHRSQLYYRIG